MAEAVLMRRAAIGLLAILLARPGLSQEALPEEPPPEAGPTVTAIEIRSEAPLADVEDLENLIVVEAGEPLTDEAVRHTLRNLQASGTASELELYTRAEGEGVVAVIVFRPVVQVEEVRFVGELGSPTRGDLARAVPQKQAEPLSEEQVVRGVYNLLDTYENTGYFNASVRVSVETDEERRRAVVTYTIASGPRSTVRSVGFDEPVEPFAPAALVEQLRLKPGEPFRRRVAREDAERLQDWLVRQQHGAARVEPPGETYDPSANVVDLTFPIEIGPRIALTVNGADEKKLRREGLLPFLGEAGYDEALLLQAEGRIEAWYQQQGHYYVEVETEESPLDGTLQIVVTVEPGPRYTLAEIEITGNEEVGDEQLRELMITTGRSLLRPGSGRLVRGELEDDLENIRRFYALEGYWQAVVGPPVVEEIRPGELRLTIPVEEGRRRRVVNLAFQGIEELDLDSLRRQFPLREGGPFHPTLLEGTLDRIRAAYAERGYAEAQVSALEDWNEDRTLVDVTIQALEGPQRVVDRIVLRGNQRTRSDVIRRTIGLDRGEPISDTRLLEIERNLYRLGIFSRVDVGVIRAGLGSTERDVLIRVEEGLPQRLTYGVGYDSEDGVRGLLGYSHNNVAGKAYSLRTDLRLSTEGDNRFRFIFNQPYLGERPIELTSTVFWEEVDDRDLSFDVTRYGARAEAVRVFGDRRVSLGLDYREVETSDLPAGLPSTEKERQNQPYQLTSLVPSFFWDRRDDPIAPTRGWSTLAQTQYAFPAFNTDAELLKVFAQQTQYLYLGRPGVIAASLRLGGIEPFSTLPSGPGDPLAGLPSRNVFIAERFFGGGDASHRAYGRNELGIRGETLIRTEEGDFVPVGGNGLLLFNLDYRFPLFGAFGGTIFYDAGNVFADWRSIDPGELKDGAGLGATYLSPIGPIRAGIGWKLDRERGEEKYELFLNIGNAF
jgi:outer membrane protein insertion porin family